MNLRTISFATQKGGAGKSTVLSLLASYLYFVKGTSIAVIDADHPQHSISALRKSESNRLQKDESFSSQVLGHVGARGLYPVAESEMEYVFKRKNKKEASAYEKCQKVNFDYVLIDTPGSLKIRGLKDVLDRSDRIIVPLEPEVMSLSSTIAFLNAVKALLPGEGAGEKVIAFWNKITIRSHQYLMEDQNAFFKDVIGIQVMKNYIPSSVRLKRNETRSTMMPISFDRYLGIGAFMDELYELL